MTSAPITSEVGNLFMGMTTQNVKDSSKANAGFSDMLKKQTSKSELSKDDAVNTSSPRTKFERSGKTVKEQEQLQSKKSRTSESDEEKALKVAEELAGQLITQVANQLGLSVEEVESLMQEMDMTQMDILDAENLTQLLVSASGEKDVLSLVTNEELYATMKELNGMLEDGLQEIASLIDESGEDFKAWMSSKLQEQDKVPTAGLEFTEGKDLEIFEAVEIPDEPQTKNETQGIKEEASTKESLVDVETVQVESSQGKQSSQSKAGSESKNEGGNNFFQQNFLNQIQNENVQGAESTAYFSPETREIMNQIMDFMKVQVDGELSQLEMQLHPESLGSLNIQLTSKEGVVTAQFTAQNDAVKAAIESQMIQLKETFEQQGVKVEAIEVMVESHAFERNLDQGSGQSSQSQQNRVPKPKMRRLNLEELDLLTEDMSQEEQMAAEIMEQNGNTVDYMA